MSWILYNPNPTGRHVGDCAVRATSKAMNTSWEDAYVRLCVNGYILGDMPNTNEVISKVLRETGYKRHSIESDCKECYSVLDFCEDHAQGSFVLFSDSHVLYVENGDYYDAWDSGDKPVYFYFSKED